MTKVLLSRHGVEFDVRDIDHDAEAFDELRALGVMSVPTVVVGEDIVVGWNPARLGALVGFEEQDASTTPRHMLSSMRTVLDAMIRCTAQIPHDLLPSKSPDRDRPLRQLVHHMLRNFELVVDADVLGEYPDRARRTVGDIAMFDTPRLVRYGEVVRAKFNAWFDSGDSITADALIETEAGRRTLMQVLERTRLHSAFHLRQVYAFLEARGIEPEAPLSLQDLRRLGMDDMPPGLDIRPPALD